MEILLLMLAVVGSASFISGDDGESSDADAGSSPSQDGSEQGPLENTDGDPLTGDGRHDLIIGTEDDDTILGRKGNDILQGRGGADTISGGSGSDRLDGEDGDDSLNGDAGNDTLIGGQGDDTLDGGQGFDFLEGRWGDDLLLGGDGNDTLDGDEGTDTLVGGAGNDTIILNGTDIGRGDDGRDEFRLQTGSDGDMIIIEDYSENEDQIVIEYEATGTEPAVGITDEGDDAFVTLNGLRVAHIQDAAGQLTPDDIVLIASGA